MQLYTVICASAVSMGIIESVRSSNVLHFLDHLEVQLGQSKVIRSGFPIPYVLDFASMVPAAMVFPETPSDVAHVLNLALVHNVVVAVRSHSGHSYIGQSSMHGEGIVMNLRNLNSLSVSAVVTESGLQYIARVGGGLRLLELYTQLAMHDPPLGINGGTFHRWEYPG